MTHPTCQAAYATTTPLNGAVSIEPCRRIVEALADSHPGVPVIGFPRGAGAKYKHYAEATGVHAMAVDQATPMSVVRGQCPGLALQGNLDPLYMVLGGDALRDEAQRICREMQGHPHIFNLGHGITPDADPANVDVLLKAIRG